MEKKKNFEYPEATIVTFSEEDVIVTSSFGDWWGGQPGDHDQD